MKVLKTFNEYLLVKSLEEKKKEVTTKGGIILTGDVEIDTLEKGEVLMIPEDVEEVSVGDTVLFYKGTGIEAGENLIVHIQNIAGILTK